MHSVREREMTQTFAGIVFFFGVFRFVLLVAGVISLIRLIFLEFKTAEKSPNIPIENFVAWKKHQRTSFIWFIASGIGVVVISTSVNIMHPPAMSNQMLMVLFGLLTLTGTIFGSMEGSRAARLKNGNRN